MIAWHGQNNGGDLEQVNEVNARLAAISGSTQPRVLLMSKLGQYEATFSGRIVVVDQEQQAYANGSGSNTARMRDFIRDYYPQFLFDTRAELCATASPTIPDLWHPGKREKETADTWGIVPFSYFFDYSAVSWRPNDLTFSGYRSAAGLPSNGTGSDLDYYIRSVADGSNPVGQLLVKEAGVWVTHSIANKIHMVPDVGNIALAKRIKLKLETKGW
ncbi:hypothetical protein [Pararhodobacter zhoushanensis]|uniref:Uncharacterized protein n=1 Tax=Pararhodobacter zhoushanensis TaxID=2479545 RepID=A0ABT3H2S2_9RHOB|nr:hypothetical protein [Pararhodobacter zhoushanensis]MCW1934130.1 hypothetical protein [Pararhodobacter zhoushanensis]